MLFKYFNDNMYYLQNGKYLVSDNNVYLVKKDKEYLNSAHRMFSDKFYLHKNKLNLKTIIKQIIYRLQTPLTLNNSKMLFNGTILFSTNQEKSIKIFDLENKLILNKFYKKEDFKINIQNYIYYRDYFLVPTVISIDEENLIYIEEMIDYKSSNNLTNDELSIVMERVFNDYIHYYSKIKTQYNIKKISDLQNNKLIKMSTLNKLLTIIFNEDYYYTVNSHGDLLNKNLLYKNENVYYIDFELSGYRYILYDIFTLIYFLYYTYGNDLFLDDYFSGKYDSYLEEIFKIFNLNYDNKFKIKYLHIFILERFLDEANDPMFNKNLFISKYKEVIEKYK